MYFPPIRQSQNKTEFNFESEANFLFVAYRISAPRSMVCDESADLFYNYCNFE